MEKPNRTFYDALTTLTAIGAVTERIELGTGSLIPFRHPLVTALMAGTITQLVGPRLILGFGAGTFDHEFEAIGMGRSGSGRARPLQRRDPAPGLHRERRHVLRRLLHIQRRDDRAEAGRWPDPVLVLRRHARARRGSPSSSATAGCPAGSRWRTLSKRIQTITDMSADRGRTRPTIAVIPPTSLEETREEALRHVNVPGLLAWANKAKFAVKPPSGRFETVEDLEGQLIVGSPDEAVAEVREVRGGSVSSTSSSTSASSSTGGSSRSNCWARRYCPS